MRTSGKNRKMSRIPVHKSMVSRSDFAKVVAAWMYIHPILAFTLIIFYPANFVIIVASLGFAYAGWLTWNASRNFDYLADNLLHRCKLSGSALPICLLGYIGACVKAMPLNEGLFILILIAGVLTLLITIFLGYSAGVKAHDMHAEKSESSIEWDRGVYDLNTSSLDRVPVHEAIGASFPTWGALVALGLIGFPGPVIGVMAGEFSSYGRYLVAIPASWGLSLFMTYFFLRAFIDYRTVRKLEKARGKRLLVSTSTLLSPTLPPG